MIVAESPQALEMRERAPELYNLEDKEAVPQTQWIPNEKSFASQAATVTTIKFLRDMGTSPATGIEDIDTQSTLWQLNWIQILEPAPGTTLRIQDGTRLWFPVLIRGFEGSMAMYITEAAALKSSKRLDAVDFYVVEYDEQDCSCAPTAEALEL